MSQRTAKLNLFWASLIVEELVRCGVRFFFLAPGSRSTALAAALAERPEARVLVHFDERGTAYAALGHAKATRNPVAWVTTSGTAVANGLPAVVEASNDTVPMILLTADRPPELQQTGANQTIVQQGIFGGHVRWEFELPAPDPTIDPAAVLTTVDQAVYRARRAPEGPVHLNLMFREPLIPGPEKDKEKPLAPKGWLTDSRPYTRYAAARPVAHRKAVDDLWESLRTHERGLVVAGRLASRDEGEAVLELTKALGWPLLPDIGSQLRLGRATEQHVSHYDLLLASEAFRERHAPDAVICIGGSTVSKRLEQFLVSGRLSTYATVRENPFRLDPHHRVTHSIEADISGFCAALVDVITTTPRSANGSSSWTADWRTRSEEVERRLELMASQAEQIGEPFVARLISENIPEGHGLFVASSMPVRDMDAFAVSSGAFVPVAANRGASGIDGSVATAAGFSRGLGSPVTLLLGDLALLHDLNSLAMLKELPMVVVVLNNNGGGIFSFLPIARHSGFFERYFGTPHGLSFEQAAAMFGLGYERPNTAAEFVAAYRAGCSREGPTLIEVITDRSENLALHRELLAAASS